MTMQPRKLLLWATLIAASAMSVSQIAAGASAASVPDFSGTWRHGTLPWLIPPASGPGPVTNKSRRPDDGTSDYGQLVGDYTNPILQPWAADVVKKKGEVSLAGEDFPSPANQCWPEPPPFLFKHMTLQMLPERESILSIFHEDHEVPPRAVNQPNPSRV